MPPSLAGNERQQTAPRRSPGQSCCASPPTAMSTRQFKIWRHETAQIWATTSLALDGGLPMPMGQIGTGTYQPDSGRRWPRMLLNSIAWLTYRTMIRCYLRQSCLECNSFSPTSPKSLDRRLRGKLIETQQTYPTILG